MYIYVEFCEGCADSKWHGPLESGEELTVTHSWEQEGEYNIRAQAKDSNDALSEWSTLPVTMPTYHNKLIINFFQSLIIDYLIHPFQN